MSLARGGRLPPGTNAAMEALNASVDVDKELWREDIQGSLAHLGGLEKAGILTADEAQALRDGFAQVKQEIESGEMVWDPRREDVHMNIEARLTEICGAVGGKLHTGRSRNDQVATDLRLWVRRNAQETVQAIEELAAAIVDVSEEEIDTLMPAYTHLQRGQPSRLSLHLMAWQEGLWRDRCRLLDATARLNESPLGAGAVAGTGFPIDRHAIAAELKFSHPMRNALDATASRDFLMEVVSVLAILGVHLSRICEELVIWSTYEFGFIRLSDDFTTSSSMMPQKKNPDVAELVRGKAAKIIGHATTLLVLEKSLAYGYGRELQEDKRPVFDAFEDATLSVRALTGAIATATYNREAMSKALEGGHVCATDLADYLVQQDVPFREAHGIVGALVREAEERGVQLYALPDDVLVAAHPALADPAIRGALDPEQAVERRALIGGPAKARVLESIAEARERWGQA